MANHGGDAADLLVIFGITGDLARRMTFRSLYRLERRELLDCPFIGVASAEISAEQLVKQARGAIVGPGEEFDDAVFGRLARRMSYLPGDVTGGPLDRRLAGELGGRRMPLFFLLVPPSLFGRRAAAPMTRRTRRRRCSVPCRRSARSTTCAASTRGTPMFPASRGGPRPRPT